MDPVTPTTTTVAREEMYAACDRGHLHHLRDFVKHVLLPGNMALPREFADGVPVSGDVERDRIMSRPLVECPMMGLNVQGIICPPPGIPLWTSPLSQQPTAATVKPTTERLDAKIHVTWTDETLSEVLVTDLQSSIATMTVAATTPSTTATTDMSPTQDTTTPITTSVAATTTTTTTSTTATTTASALPTRTQILARLESLEIAMAHLQVEVASLQPPRVERPI